MVNKLFLLVLSFILVMGLASAVTIGDVDDSSAVIIGGRQSCTGSCGNINVSAIYNETDPLWTANSTLVPYLARDNVFTGQNSFEQTSFFKGTPTGYQWFYNYDEADYDWRIITANQNFTIMPNIPTGQQRNFIIGNILRPTNLIVNNNATADKFIGNGSLLTGVCLNNGTGCLSSPMNYTNIAMLNQSNVFTKFNNFSDQVIFRNASGNTNVVIQASSGDTANQQIFQIKNNAGTSVFYQRADGFSATASLGTTDDNSVQIIDSSVATADYPRGISLGSSSVVGWGSSNWWSAKNVGLSRTANGEISVGNGTQGSYTGRLKTSGVSIWNDGDLSLYGTFPHFLLNESDCPFGICVNSYIIMDGNRFQIQGYSASGSYLGTVFDLNMRPTTPTFSGDYVGRVGLGLGTGSAVGWTNFRNSTSTIPQIWLQNSTLSTTSSGGALQRKDNDLWFTDNSLNTTQILISRNTTRYTCDALATGQVGTNATGSYGCNGSCWGAWNGTAVECGRRLF